MEIPTLQLKEMLSTATQKDVAAKLGVSQQYLSDVLTGRRAPGKSILDALGLEKVISYRRKRRK